MRAGAEAWIGLALVLAEHVPGAAGHTEDHRAQVASQPTHRRLGRLRGGGAGVGGGPAAGCVQVDARGHGVVRLLGRIRLG